MLINLSNHSSEKWKKEQLEAAAEFGEIVDWEFPYINPQGDEDYIKDLANKYAADIWAETLVVKNVTVHIMGEMTFTFAVVSALHSMGVACIASTTERIVTELDLNRKEVQFVFSRFRKYL